MTSAIYKVTGMDCAECALTIEKGVRRLDGVQTARVDLATARLTVDGIVTRDSVRTRVEALGYGLEAEAEPHSALDKPAAVQSGGLAGFGRYLVSNRETQLGLIGGGLILVAFLMAVLHLPALVANSVLVAAVLVGAYTPAQNGIRTLLINHDFSIDLLMVIAASGALLIGDFLEGATVIFLFAVGEALEGYTVDRARHSLNSLIDLAPGSASKLDGGRELTLPVGDLQVGDLIVIKPGERIPMDGRVEAGESDVNQAPITGESIPVFKGIGAEVYAGSVNGAGSLRVTVTHLAADNTLSRIIQLVEEAQSERAPSQRVIEQFAHWYTPAVVIAALLVATLPPLLFGAPFLNTPTEQGWLYRALILLVIACPCALVISAPVTILSGITAAARRGVLVKGGAHLEALAQVRAFAFDKTGTLTEGRPKVTISRAVACTTGAPCELCDDVLALASAVEQSSAHPLARAVVQAAHERGVGERYAPAATVEAMAGRGVRGQVNGKLVTVGSHDLFDAEHPHGADFHRIVLDAEEHGQTALMLSDGDAVRGFMAVADTVRPDSARVIADLRALGMTTVMLTGDNAASAQAVAQQVGVDEVRAGLLPEEKLVAIHALQTRYPAGGVAMVGDGINDAPALAAANVGIAMGGAGSAQALETADIALLADDLQQLPYALRLARLTRGIIVQNVVISLATKLLIVTLAIAGSGSMWLAIAADVGVALLVILNGMRPMRFEAR